MNKNLYFDLVKIDPDQKMVYGYASTEKRDSQGEIVKLDAIKSAYPDWFKFGNIREMHTNWAVGVAKSAEMDENGLYISAKIVDKDAWEKCKEGVYKGLSIGGSVTERDEDDSTIIKGIELTEISLVDRPANPEAILDVVKANSKPQDDEDAEDEADGGDDEETETEGEGDDEDKPKKKIAAPKVKKVKKNKTEDRLAKLEAEEYAAVEFAASAPALIRETFKRHGIDAEKIQLVLSAASPEDKLNKEFAWVHSHLNSTLEVLDICAKAMRGADKDSVQAIHDHTSRMGADCGGKSAAVQPGDLSKMAVRAETAEKALTDATDTIVKLNTEVERLKAMPMPPKGPKLAITKSQDITPTDEDTNEAEAFSKLSDEEKTRYLIKKSFASGGTPFRKLSDA